jgi:hypothetical protein
VAWTIRHGELLSILSIKGLEMNQEWNASLLMSFPAALAAIWISWRFWSCQSRADFDIKEGVGRFVALTIFATYAARLTIR